eukprot:gene6615-7125_t
MKQSKVLPLEDNQFIPTELEKKGRGRRFISRPWSIRTFALNGVNLEYYADGKLKDTINILGTTTERLEPHQADNKAFPFVIHLNGGEDLILNASDEETRARCLDVFNSKGETKGETDNIVAAAAVVDKAEIMRPMRLLKASLFGELFPIPPYELIPESHYVSVPFEEFMSSFHEKCAVISWRWGPKPRTLEDAKDVEKRALTVSKDLVRFCCAQLQAHPEIEYLWLDWACIPQYQGAAVTMDEINRSGNYYRKAKMMIIWCFDHLSEERFQIKYSSYFGRVWTLSERLHRGLGSFPLKVDNFLPLILRSASSYPDHSIMRMTTEAVPVFHAEDDNLDEWIPITIHQFVAVMSDGKTWDTVPMARVHAKIDLIVSKFGHLRRIQQIVEDHLSLLLDVSSFHFMQLSVRLFAFFEWMKEDATNAKLSLGTLRQTQYYLLYQWTLRERKFLDNLNFLSHSKEIAQCRSLLSDLNLQTVVACDKPPEKIDDFVILGNTAAQIWHNVVVQPITERVSEAWLARYMTYHAGSVYQAFDPYDLFLAVQKLFKLPDCRDREMIGEVWMRLAQIAGIETGSVYSWIRNITRPGSDAFLSTCTMSYTRKQVDAKLSDNPFVVPIHPKNSIDSLNFKILGFDEEARRGLESFRSFEDIFISFPTSQASAPQKWLISDDKMVFTYALGVYFPPDSRLPTAEELLASWSWVSVGIGGEIDSHLSLRGRNALRVWETSLRDELANVLSSEGSERSKDGNALFLLTRYHPYQGHARTAIFWTFGHAEPENAHVVHWCVEGLASLPSLPMKGSPWGICEVYKLLGEAMMTCGALGSQVAQLSVLPADIDACERIVIELPAASGQTESWWRFGWNYQLNIEKEPLPSKPSAEERLGEVLAALAPFQKMAKSTMTEADLLQLDLLLELISLIGISDPVPTMYWQMLQSNYVYDRVMAKNLWYFAQFGKKLVEHMSVLPNELFSIGQIQKNLSNFVEDLGDALEYAEDDGVESSIVEEARNARNTLRDLLQ